MAEVTGETRSTTRTHHVSLSLLEKVGFEQLSIPNRQLGRSTSGLRAFASIDHAQNAEAAYFPRRVAFLSVASE